MVRKGIVSSRAKKGIIPSKNQRNDRSRTVHQLFKLFSNYLPQDKKPKMINFSRHVLEIGESDNLFSGKDPYISGIAVFVYSTRKFLSDDDDDYITYSNIKRNFGHFAAGESFTNLLRTLEFYDP